ncbi:hypothetical protein [Oligoflexus tunisiensis]|uniref:hypothetical protein n=1 Tax=Oligoflexus tunisiensis TaxID=708132 RepID=UPI001C4036E6|nr:hypothetical protein [Oligoflexus tunisiensis]
MLNLGCHPQRTDAPGDLPAIFPHAARALGPFSIHLETSRDTNVLSEARMKVEQSSAGKHVTVQLKMIPSREQVTLSFVHQSQAQTGKTADQPFDPSRCMPLATDSMLSLPEQQTAPLQDTAALLHIPLPRSIRDAKDIQVSGVGHTWAIAQDALVWHSSHETQHIALSWTRENVPQIRYPLKSAQPPQNLRARRVEQGQEVNIPVQWQDGFVWIQSEDVRPGAWLELRYDLPGQDATFTLPQMPVFGNMNLLALQVNCPRESFLLERSELSWSCPPAQGSLWATSYSYNHVNGAWNFADWPELEHQAPASVAAYWDAGEKLEVESHGRSHVLPNIPAEASRLCLHATWSSDPSH